MIPPPSGFNVLFDNGAVIFPQVILPTNFFELPGHQSVWAAYSSGRYAIVDPQSLNQIPPALQGLPADDSCPRLLVGHLFVRPGSLGGLLRQDSKLGSVRQPRDQ